MSLNNLVIAKKLISLACEIMNTEDGGFYRDPQKSPESVPAPPVDDIRNYLDPTELPKTDAPKALPAPAKEEPAVIKIAMD